VCMRELRDLEGPLSMKVSISLPGNRLLAQDSAILR
jgi:hypothetical protein